MDSSDPNLARLLEERRRTGRAHGELTARRPDGSLFLMEMSSVVFPAAAGHEFTCTIFRDISVRKQAQAERERLIVELKEAMGKVRMLNGLLPICASCKKIRNEHDHWEHLETYIRQRSAADFTHGLCPDCLAKLYPQPSSD